jgi:hypothetical protein
VSRREDLERFDRKLEEWTQRHPVWAWVVAFGISLVLFGVAIGLEEILRFLFTFLEGF